METAKTLHLNLNKAEFESVLKYCKKKETTIKDLVDKQLRTKLAEILG